MKDFREMKQRGEKITALTAYDYPTARLLDETGIDIILVGDSLGMVVLGYRDTTSVTLEEMLHHTRAAARGVKQALLVADMPIHTYDTPQQAVATARKFVDAGAQAVKLEGGASRVAEIEAITQTGIRFMAHIGMLPQSVREEGGRIFGGAGDCARRGREANHKSDRDPNYWHWFRRALRWTNSGNARSDRPVSLVYTEVCFARGACGGRDSPRGQSIRRANEEQRQDLII